MINYNSTQDEIHHHMQQMQTIILSEKENQQIKKIMELQSFLNTPEMRAMIGEDLKDERWVDDTKVLIATAQRKHGKNKIIVEHLSQCHNLLIYKILEKKCHQFNLEVVYQNRELVFNDVDSKGERARWINNKLMRLLTNSSIEKILIKESAITMPLPINLKWLYSNRDSFFTEDLFENLNFTLLKKNRMKI